MVERQDFAGIWLESFITPSKKSEEQGIPSGGKTSYLYNSVHFLG